MSEVKYTLVGDGPSDAALLPILNWLLSKHLPDTPIQPQWGDLRHLRQRPAGLEERIRTALDLYPCDVLFVHRDAEREDPARRVDEVNAAMGGLAGEPPHVCIVPVRMTEAWLLFEERALRTAAGNPNGTMPLALPALRDTEALPDPKETLRELARQASGLAGRRLKNLRVTPRRVAELIDDFAPLRNLPAFQRLESDVVRVAGQLQATA